MVPLIFHRSFSAASSAVILLGFSLFLTAATAEKPAPAPESKPLPEEEKKFTREDVETLIEKLASDDFAARETAEQELGKGITITGGLAELARQKFLKTPDPEVHFRLRRILRSVVEPEYFGRKKAFLGIQMQDSIVIGGKTGRETILSVMVLSLIPDASAEKQGIREGDHILEVDGKGFEVTPSLEFKGMISSLSAGDTVKFKLRRGGVLSDKTVKLGEMPPDIARLYAESPLAFESFFQSWLLHGGEITRQ